MGIPPAQLWQDELEQALARDLPAFMPGQRWFGAKARRIVSVCAEDTVWLRAGEEPCAWVVARVEYARGAPERYALLLALRREPGALPPIASLTARGERRELVEAASHGPDAASLLQHLGDRHDLAAVHGGALRFADTSTAPGTIDGARIRPLGAEQSNTSLGVGTEYVFKLFRRIESGENPEVEIGRFLAARASFRAAPALRGTVTWMPAEGSPGTAGALQDWLENRGDGWAWALAELERYFSSSSGPEPLVTGIQRLGTTTAEFHAALASSPDTAGFIPEPVGQSDVERWKHDLGARAEGAFQALEEGLGDLTGPGRAVCQRLLELRPRVQAVTDLPAPSGEGAFSKIRIHGDYHLGQTLKTREGFALIDFEGEPARPLAERRRPHCALRDVAGMVRSFDYAVEVARERTSGRAATAPMPPALRESFLIGYQTRAQEQDARFLPSDREAQRGWIDFFELHKAFYEVEYEAHHRPTWLHIPVSGAVRLLERMAS